MTKFYFILFQFCFLLSCADNEEVTINPGDPANLQLNILVYDNDSGIVAIDAIADNAVEFRFFLDDGDDNPIIQSTGFLEYTYANTGTYDLEVQAYGSSGRFIKEEKRITVISQAPVDSGEGYSTPIEYDGYILAWNDEFDGASLDLDSWSYDIGTGCPNLCGWGNNELEYYREVNCQVRGGALTIQAKAESFEGQNFTSCKLVTRDKLAMHFGRIDFRAKMPKGQGIWPALWMLGVNQPVVGWPKCGEIDVMEMIGGSGRERFVSANAFWDQNGVRDNQKSFTVQDGTLADEFFVYSLIWDEQKIQWLLNDTIYHEMDITAAAFEAFQNPFYIIMNVAIGGNWPGAPDATTEFPTEMQVDYVRIFEKQ